MLEYGNYFETIQSASVHDKGYLGALAKLNKLEVNTVTPLLFDLFSALTLKSISEDDMNTAIGMIESFFVRRLVCGLPTASLNKIFAYIGDEIEKYRLKNPNVKYIDILAYILLSKTGKSRFPNDHDFDEKFMIFELYNCKSNIRKYIFERLENAKSKEKIAVEEQIESGELTIEHIMPQTLTKEWKKSLGTSWEWIHTKYLHTLGNLTLTAYNSDYSNLSFENKLFMKEKGIIYSKLVLNEDIKKCKTWGEKEIVNRTKLLLGWAKTIWPMPVTSFSPVNLEEWVSLEDDVDFTNLSIKKMVICGDEYQTDSVTGAYKIFCKIMYELDSNPFSNIIHRNNLKQLRAPYMLAHNVYIETDLPSQNKITAMQDIFSKMDLGTFSEIRFFVKPKPKKFMVEDESSYELVKVGALAKALFTNLLTKHCLSQNDIEKLMDKKYSSILFPGLYYPVLSYNGADYQDGTHKRFYVDAVNVDGKDIFISSQWFEESRESLIAWYKEHNTF